MNYKSTFLFLVLIVPFNAFGSVEKLIDDLLAKELSETNDGLFPVSWAYSNEGGVIKYAEMDLVGDDRKEILYYRSTQPYSRHARMWIGVCFQPEGEEDYVALGGEILLGHLHKKEDGKSIFLKASEGKNHDTPDEPAFTKTLVIQEVTTGGIEKQTIRIDGNSESQIKEMWKYALSANEESSIAFMSGLGFSAEAPIFSWISLKSYLEGGEWKVDNSNDWSSLNEFETGGVTWSVHNESITPSFLKFGRQVWELKLEKVLRQDETGIPYKDVDFPKGYLSPQRAHHLLLEKMGTTGESSGAGDKTSTTLLGPGHGDEQLDSRPLKRTAGRKPESAETAAFSSMRWPLVAAFIAVGLGLLWAVFKMRK